MTGRGKLRRFLQERKLTQEAFAQLAGVPGPQVSLWLSGKRRPGPDSIAKLEAATGGLITLADWVNRKKRRAVREGDGVSMASSIPDRSTGS